MCKKSILFALLAAPLFCQTPPTIITIAGTGAVGDTGDGGKATSATLGAAHGVAVDNAGNVYIADGIYNNIRKVDTNGIISTFAGGTFAALGDNGPAKGARLILGPAFHVGMTFDKSGNLIIADPGDMRVRKVDLSTGIITTIAGSGTVLGIGGFSGDDGPAIDATLNTPVGVAFDSAGNLYIADFGNQRIRKVDTTGKISTFAGIGIATGSNAGDGGPANKAELTAISDVAVDNEGNVYIADQEHIRKVDKSGIITTAAHGFFGMCTLTAQPVSNSDVSAKALVFDKADNMFIADNTGGCIQELSAGMVTTYAGAPATTTSVVPAALALDSSGNLYVANGSQVQKIGASLTPPANAPSFTEAGIVNGASFAPGGVVPGEIATIFGSNLTSATGINLASSLPLSTELENVTVTVNGVQAPIFAVDNVNGQQQINFQVPWTTKSIALVQVANRGVSSPIVYTSVPVTQPAVFTYTIGTNVFGAILHADFKPANTASPAKAGETVLIYCTGLGYVNGPLPADGVPSTGQTAMNSATVTIGGKDAPVSFTGLAPGFVGLYQVNAQVPSGLAAGNQPVLMDVGGYSSKSVLLPVQ